METKFFLSFILISSWVFLGFSIQEPGKDELGPSIDSKCLSKLVPCQSSLKNPTLVSTICCIAIKELLEDHPKCLCGMFFNAELLKKLQVTQEDLLRIPATCGTTNIDPDGCDKLPASSPTAAVVSGNGTQGSNSTIGKSSANELSTVKVYGLVASFVMLLSAF